MPDRSVRCKRGPGRSNRLFFQRNAGFLLPPAHQCLRFVQRVPPHGFRQIDADQVLIASIVTIAKNRRQKSLPSPDGGASANSRVVPPRSGERSYLTESALLC